jgi:glycosyltransferase involved in cell wall biosynthesis
MEGLINPIVLVSHYGKVEEKLNGMGVKTVIHPFFYFWERPKPLKTAIHHPTRTALFRFLTLDKKCINETISELNGIRVDIVHSNSSISTVGVGLAKHLGAKHVWHIREFLDMDFGVSIYGGRNRLRRLIDGADARICVSSAVAKHWRLTTSNTFVLWDTVVGSEPSKEFVLPKEPFFLFCAANITERKGANTAVKAFCMSKLSSKEYRLKIVGHCEDAYKERLLAIASGYEESLSIDFIDYSDDITDYFAKATAFLMCSQCEALGRVTIQAMKNHCPVIAYNAGGTVDFVRHNETGLLFNTIEECSNYMRDVVNKDFSQMLDKAYEFANKSFSFDNYRKKLYEIYRSLIFGENNKI